MKLPSSLKLSVEDTVAFHDGLNLSRPSACLPITNALINSNILQMTCVCCALDGRFIKVAETNGKKRITLPCPHSFHFRTGKGFFSSVVRSSLLIVLQEEGKVLRVPEFPSVHAGVQRALCLLCCLCLRCSLGHSQPQRPCLQAARGGGPCILSVSQETTGGSGKVWGQPGLN